jgi:hypothetical protein
VTHFDFPANNLQEFITYTKANHGEGLLVGDAAIEALGGEDAEFERFRSTAVEIRTLRNSN